MATTFIAVQCSECSTMQVKQQKKSSNKWTCVVCNQTQSVRKVFARGLVAKEVRFFVQSFNMARSVSHQSPNAAPDDAARSPHTSLPKPTDWTQYLDRHHEDNQEEGDNCEVKFVTEMPNDVFKRPKLNNYSTAGAGKKLMKPVFPRGNSSKLDVTREKEPKKLECNGRAGTAKRTSKWDSYMAQDDEYVGCDNQRGVEPPDHMSQTSNDVFNSVEGDQSVEEDVHPDFM